MSDYSTNASVNLQINGQQAQETLANLKKAALNLTEQIAKAAAAGDKVTLKKLRKEFSDVKRQIKEMESTTMQVESVLKRLDHASPRDLQRTLATLNKQLEYMERGSEAWNAHTRKIRAVKDEIAKVNGELAKSQTLIERFNAMWQTWQTVAASGVLGLTGAVMAGKKAVQMYAEMEQEMASVRKYTGMTAEQVEHLNEAFKKIDTRSSREELNRLAQEAGRLGKTSEEDVLGFVKAADQINVALDELGEGATLQLSKLTSIFGDEERLGTERSLLAVGSVINELSQNCTAGASYLAQFGQRLAGVGAQAGMTVPQVMAFGAVLDSQGQKVEMSATALSKLIMNLFKNTEKIANATGMDLEKFNAALKSSTNEGLLMLLNRLNELGDMSVLAPVFADMGENGARASAVISALAGNIDMLIWEQEEAAKAFEEGTSVTKEFEVQNNTVQAGLDKARKGFQEMAIALGQELMPVMRHFISSTSATMRLMLKLVQFIKEHKAAIASITAAVAAYTIAVNLALIKEKLHAALIAVKTAALHVHKVAVLAASVAYNKMTGNVVRANAAMKLLNATMMSNPWGLLAAAVVGAGVALYAFIKRQKEANKEQNNLTEAQKRQMRVQQQINEHNKAIDEEYAKQAGTVQSLTKIVNNDNLSLEKRREVLKRLQEIVPDYHASLTDEGKLINDNKDALDKYLVSLKQSIRMKMNQEKLEDIATKQIPLEDEMKRLQAQVDEWEEANRIYKEMLQTGEGYKSEENVKKAIRENNHMISQYTHHIRSLKKEWQELEDVANGISLDMPEPTGSPKPNAAAPPAGGDDKKGKTNKFQAEDDWKEREQALNRIAYAKGEADYDAYTKRMLEIEVQYNKKKLAHTDLAGNEQVTIEAAYYEALKKQKNNAIEGTVQQEEAAYKEIMAVLQQRYMDGELSARQYQNAIELAELEHLRKVAGLYEEGSKERLKAEKNYHDTSLKYQQKHLQEDKRLQEKFRQELFTKAYQTTDTESYERDLHALELVQAQMLKAVGDNAKDRLKLERAFQEAKYRLGRKYNVKNAKEMKKSYRSAIDDIADWLKSDGGQAFTGALETILSGMSSIFSGISDMIQAELDIETAKIQSSYDAQISAAEGNKYQEVQLEQQKQKEMSKAKAEANKKMFAMQVIQAVAQTAMSAISAYSSAAAIPVVGFILAPIAAAMAVAAGAIQIASIKKQQQASESQGYAEGGFTPAGPKYKEVGVVHAGEWVASQQLLANPQARAMVNTLDYAQRTNQMGVLSAADVSRQITAPTVVAQASQDGRLERSLAATASAIAAYSSTMDDLSKRLNEPFVTVNTVTGDKGIMKAQEEYDQLMKNKTPKSRRQ
ncbi:MAG: phage tail tape measure protein [Paludibacteraceae bacterium]|nr:phage tail tape measure protein [Paludibacteraceae bacterium]